MLKPILFNTEMVRAILDGRKTVTRRPINPRYRDDEYGFFVCTNDSTGERWVEKYNADEGDFEQTRYVNPPYQVGDILYVRETWNEVGTVHKFPTGYIYKASPELFPNDILRDLLNCKDKSIRTTFKPSIHMPKEAARIFLKVTEVRVERVQVMKLQDFLNEGIKLRFPKVIDRFTEDIATGQFIEIWNSVYGNWSDNPWVWVIKFERCTKEGEKIA